MMDPLPIDPLLPQVVSTLHSAGALVLEAPPGAGKTTRVPRALLDAESAGNVLVLEPRRLAARLAAKRVAQELGEEPGRTIGWQVRFEDVGGPGTRVRFVTEGILSRRLVDDPQLSGVRTVIVDEFHERHLQADTGLALLRRLRRTSRPELRIAVLSATLETAPVAEWLGAPALRSEGRRFDVAVEHLPLPDSRPLHAQVASALRRVAAESSDGHVLVFLPGAAEIRRALQACEAFAAASGVELCALHGDLPAREQDRAVAPSARRKAILSTNVAESSVTIDGVVAVVDSGLVRVASHSPWSGLPMLRTARTSRASAEQRSGRAGRTRPGRCVRLYTRHDFETRVPYDEAEIRRADLAQTVLELRAAGVDPRTLEWFEPPPAASLEAADELLRRLGAAASDGAPTDVGRRMLRFPLHPRLARIVVEAERLGVADEACAVAAVLGERDLREREGLHGPRLASVSAESDPEEIAEALVLASNRRFDPGETRALGLDPGAARGADRVRMQLRRLAHAAPSRSAVGALRKAVFSGFPDRVARRRPGARDDLLLSGGGAASLSQASVVRGAEWMVAVDAEEQRSGVLVRMASAIDPDWLLDVPGGVEESAQLVWNERQERVESVSRLSYGALVLDERTTQPEPSDEVSALLLAKARAAGVAAFADAEEVESLRERMRFAAATFPERGVTAPAPDAVDRALAELCRGRRSFAELRDASFLSVLRGPTPPHVLDELAPATATLPGGRRLRIRYEAGKPPSVASRLQDFFGMAQGPMLGGRVPLVLHLLAPNGRDVQVTTDLAGFWQRHYPALRRELMRRYPRHDWPEDPLRARPPSPGAKGRAR